MVMGRVNVCLTGKLLDDLDAEAKKEKTNRSAFIQTALEKYIEAKRRGREEEDKRKQTQEASRKMDALAKKLGNWNLRQGSENSVIPT